MLFHKRELRIGAMLSFSRVLDQARGEANIFPTRREWLVYVFASNTRFMLANARERLK